MIEYICGPIVLSDTVEAAIAQVQPELKLIETIMISDSTVCTPREAVPLNFLNVWLPIAFIIFLLIGVALGSTLKSEQKMTEEEDIKQEYSEKGYSGEGFN